MSTVTSERQVTIQGPDAPELKKRLTKAIAAAFRWKASYREDYEGDDDNMLVLAQLLEEIAEMD